LIATEEWIDSGGGGEKLGEVEMSVERILGVNERWYPKVGGLTDRTPVTVVLIGGDVGDYAAYIGGGTKDDAEWIARYGDKLSFEEACCHFPGGQLKEENYRV